MNGNYLYNHICKMEKAMKFCKRGALMSFSFFHFFLLVKVTVEGDHQKCYNVYLN